jgi:hypothetical protein
MNKPIFIRKDSKKEFQWRIRNLPYPKENFSIEVDKAKGEIIIKTLNKKYYKRFDIPDLKRNGIGLDGNNISVDLINNTLIISVILNYSYLIVQQTG